MTPNAAMPALHAHQPEQGLRKVITKRCFPSSRGWKADYRVPCHLTEPFLDTLFDNRRYVPQKGC